MKDKLTPFSCVGAQIRNIYQDGLHLVRTRNGTFSRILSRTQIITSVWFWDLPSRGKAVETVSVDREMRLFLLFAITLFMVLCIDMTTSLPTMVSSSNDLLSSSREVLSGKQLLKQYMRRALLRDRDQSDGKGKGNLNPFNDWTMNWHGQKLNQLADWTNIRWTTFSSGCNKEIGPYQGVSEKTLFLLNQQQLGRQPRRGS